LVFYQFESKVHPFALSKAECLLMITLTKVWQDPSSMLTEKVHLIIKKGQSGFAMIYHLHKTRQNTQ